MRRLTLLVILVLVAACGTSASSMSPAPTAESLVPGAENPPTKASDAQATDIDGRFQLNFSLPQASYRTTDAITGEAALSVTDGKDARIGGPGAGPLGFTFVEVAGTRRMEAGWDLS